MKNRYIIAVLLLMILGAACKENEGIVYEEGIYLQFQWNKDSTVAYSFKTTEPELPFLLPLQLTGQPPVEDTEYKIEVVAEETTAIEGVHYELPKQFIYRGGQFRDTCRIILKKSDDLKTEEVKLVLRFKDIGTFKLGQIEYLKYNILLHDKVDKPEWWDNNINWYYLGTYSEKKYRLFIDVTGVSDLSEATTSEIRAYALEFSYYLQEKKAAGETVYEDEEQKIEMKVPVII